MATGTPSDKYIESFTKGTMISNEIRPFRTPVAFHNFDSDIFALVEFPIKVILVALQEVFSKTGKWRYNSDVSKTNIYIQDRYPQTSTGEAERPSLRPAIITDRGPITVANVNGRNHCRRVTPQQGESGLVTYEDLVNCPMTVHCLAPGKGPEAERMACVVFGMLVVDEMSFKRRGVHAILNPEIGTEGPLEQTAHLDLVDVPVSFVMQYAWAWARRPDGGFIETLESLEITDP